MIADAPSKPSGSIKEEIDDFDGRTYRWKPPSGGPIRFFVVGFLVIWLCGWAVGLVAATAGLLQDGKAPREFLIVWLVGWSLGGIFAIFMLYVLFRPSLPESITLKHDSFYYDSGTSPPMTFFNPWYAMRHSNPHEAFGGMFKRRTRIEVNKNDLGNLVLERIGERQRLYFDFDADRIEIGRHLREPEREWLADVIQIWKTK